MGTDGGRTWRTWQLLAAAGVSFLLGIGAGASGAEKDETVSATGAPPSTQPAPQVTAAPTTPTVPATPAPTPAPTVATTVAGPKITFADGTHRVGVDIAPGTYVAPGGSPCYWERQSVFGGSGTDAIIANDISRGGQAVVTIEASDKGFKTTGCGTWKPG